MQRALLIKAPIEIDDEAGAVWDAEYVRLEQERPGNYGYATSRLSVHALKVALIYAAFDGSTTMRLPHLRAALSLIDYADRSALETFGMAVGVGQEVAEQPHARLLDLARTRQDGITKTDAHRLFSNKRKAAEIDSYFTLLTPSFGEWKDDRWFARQKDGPTGCGVVPQTPPANGEACNGTEAVKEEL